MNDDEVLNGLGPRLRALRIGRGRTLSDISEVTGISVSTLSRLESAHRRPTLELLLPLARAYQVQLDELVDAPVTGDPRIHPKAFTRYGTTFIPLTRRPGGVQAYKQIVPVSWPTHCAPERVTHEGYEWMYVLSGRMRILLGEHDVTLGAGEVAEFDTRTPHFMSNPGPGTAELLVLFGPQGERAHIRARPRRLVMTDDPLVLGR